MPNPVRLERIGNRIRALLTDLLLRDIQDPRLSNIFVNDVKVDRELAYAEIYVSALDSSREKEIIEGLESANGYIRKTLSQQIELRTFPRLRFRWDPIPEKADRIERILSSLKEENKQE